MPRPTPISRVGAANRARRSSRCEGAGERAFARVRGCQTPPDDERPVEREASTGRSEKPTMLGARTRDAPYVVVTRLTHKARLLECTGPCRVRARAGGRVAAAGAVR